MSPDALPSHDEFSDKYNLAELLLCDTDHRILKAYGAWSGGKGDGKPADRVVRSTVLIDPEGTVRFTWPDVQVKGHAEEVLQTIRKLQQS